MKNFTRTILVQLLMLGPTITYAQSWVTVDDYQLGGNYTYGAAIATGSTGAVFAAGTVSTPGGITGIVRRSLDHGATWATVDTSSEWYEVHAVAVSPVGHVVVVGSARANQSGSQEPLRWLTRLSEDGGTTWATVDDFVYSPDESCRATAVDVAADGTIYVAGFDNSGHWLVRRRPALGGSWNTVATLSNNVPLTGYNGPLTGMKLTRTGMFLTSFRSVDVGQGNSVEKWTVLRSADQLASWQVVDDWLFPGSDACQPRGIAEDSHGNLVVVGRRSFNGSSQVDWVTRRSVDGGDTWSLVDEINDTFEAYAVAADTAGSVWATGTSYEYRTRVSHDGGATWTDSDRFLYDVAGGASSRPAGIAADGAGNIFAIGTGYVYGGKSHWIVRKLTAVGPALSVVRKGSTLELSWPTNSPSFVLQSATTLTSGGNWQDFPTPPTEINGQQVVTITPSGSRGFFRLRGP